MYATLHVLSCYWFFWSYILLSKVSFDHVKCWLLHSFERWANDLKICMNKRGKRANLAEEGKRIEDMCTYGE